MIQDARPREAPQHVSQEFPVPIHVKMSLVRRVLYEHRVSPTHQQLPACERLLVRADSPIGPGASGSGPSTDSADPGGWNRVVLKSRIFRFIAD